MPQTSQFHRSIGMITSAEAEPHDQEPQLANPAEPTTHT
jgi:hypothetical protein